MGVMRITIPDDDEVTNRFFATQGPRSRSLAVRMLAQLFVAEHGYTDVMNVVGRHLVAAPGQGAAPVDQPGVAAVDGTGPVATDDEPDEVEQEVEAEVEPESPAPKTKAPVKKKKAKPQTAQPTPQPQPEAADAGADSVGTDSAGADDGMEGIFAEARNNQQNQ